MNTVQIAEVMMWQKMEIIIVGVAVINGKGHIKEEQKMFEEIKRYADFIHWMEEKHPEVLNEYKEVIETQEWLDEHS